jgi:ATP-dependent RNA helicase DeaD
MTEKIELSEAAGSAAQPEISEAATFVMADLPPALQETAHRLNWTELMPVQSQTIPLMLAGGDVMVQSQTGSGKTGAFLLPILHRIDPALGAPQALILAPTRELAVQVSRDAEELGLGIGVRSLAIYGGVGYKPQIQGLEAGAQLIIGTPGRILDHLLKGTLNLDRLKVLIFDEADRMLSMGFYPDMKQLQRYLPRGLQSAMFSATYPGHVKRLAQQFLKDPVFVSLSQTQVHASDVLHVVYKVPAMQKSRILVKIIEQENPASAIIFCNTKADVHFVSVVLRRFGYDVGEISADLSQAAREEVLEKLRQNKLKFLVATDVAARGIDIHELSHVFQYQPPQDHEAYVHRTGRTGRAGAAGVAISFVSGMEEIELEQIAKKFSINLEERQVPADEELEILISQRAVFLMEARLRGADNIQKERMQRFSRIVTDLAANEDSRLLLAMLIDEFYQKTFHAPLEQPTETMMDVRRPSPRPAVTPDRPERVESVVASEGGERPEGEKRRRKRSRKKPANGAEPRMQEGISQEMEGRVSPPAAPKVEAPALALPVVDQEVRSVSSADAEPDSSDSAFGFGEVLDSIWDHPETGENNEAAVAPAKKRRRRRPRKSGGPKPEAVVETSGESDAPTVSAVPPTPVAAVPERQAPTRPTGNHQRGHSRPEPAKSKDQERGRGGESQGKSAPPAPPAKPKKKIFLE